MQFVQKSPIMYGMDKLTDTILPPDRSKNIIENKFYRMKDDKEIIVIEYDEAIFKDELYKNAEKQFAANEYEKALESYKKLFAKFPDYSRAQTLQAKCLIKLNKSDDAVDLLRSAISDNFIDYEAHQLLGKLYADMDLLDVALRYITTAHILNRNDAEINQQRIEMFTKKGYKAHNWVFVPQVKYEASSKNITMYCKEQFQFYAAADALWTYDTDYRQTKNNLDKKVNLNRLQETMLMHSVALQRVPWYSATEEGTAFKTSLEKKLINEFIYYEIVLPQYPEEVQKFSEEQVNKLVNYVLTIRGELK
jgi:tetratricopeptide (TPR) repeat protein